jgi:ATP adenylyltransferase
MGLRGEVIGWGGVLEFVAEGKARRVVYVLVQAQPGPDFARHAGHDTLLLNPSEAVAALTHEDARSLAAEALRRIGIPVVTRP